jgi:hypothetical protein
MLMPGAQVGCSLRGETKFLRRSLEVMALRIENRGKVARELDRREASLLAFQKQHIVRKRKAAPVKHRQQHVTRAVRERKTQSGRAVSDCLRRRAEDTGHCLEIATQPWEARSKRRQCQGIDRGPHVAICWVGPRGERVGRWPTLAERAKGEGAIRARSNHLSRLSVCGAESTRP